MSLSFGEFAPAVAVAASTLANAFLILGTWWFGRRATDYSHRRDTISELGASGTRDASAVAWLWFLPNSLAFAAAGLAIGEGLSRDADDASRTARLLSGVGIGWLGASIFPCDKGAPTFGTLRNHLHNLAGGGAYLLGAAGLMEMGAAIHHTHPALALLARAGGGAVMIGLLAISAEGPVRGLIQRIMEGILHGWLMIASLSLLFR